MPREYTARWSADSIDYIRTLANSGQSGREIAARFGVTRNTIIGICHRNAIALGGRRHSGSRSEKAQANAVSPEPVVSVPLHLQSAVMTTSVSVPSVGLQRRRSMIQERVVMLDESPSGSVVVLQTIADTVVIHITCFRARRVSRKRDKSDLSICFYNNSRGIASSRWGCCNNNISSISWMDYKVSIFQERERASRSVCVIN